MSRSAACALFAAWVSFVACAAVPVFADDGVGSPTAEATAAADAAPAAPVIEVVREGGVAEAWREEGSAFATYGPDGEAVVPTPERQALQALANAYDVQFVALRGPGPGCADGCLGDCVGGLPVADRITWVHQGSTRPLGTGEQAAENWEFRREYLGSAARA